jgi:Domain of unknown function (DUF4340)
MRGGRSFLVLLVVALGLGAYIYFVEFKREPDAAAAKDKVFSVESDKIQEIQIRAATGEATTLKKDGTTWQIVAPETLAADQTAVNSLVSTLQSLEVQRTVDENPAAVAEFGLAPPRFTVSFKAEGDAALHTFEAGNKTPTGADLYARVEGQPKLFLVSSYVEDSLNRKPFDLRDKTILKFTRDGVDAMKIAVPGSPALALTRKVNEWRLDAPIAARADFNAVDGIVGRLYQLQMASIAADEVGADARKYGLDKPQVVVTLGLGSSSASFAVGGKADDTTVYARDLSRPQVFTVESSLVTDLTKKADDLRMKDVFAFRSFSAVGLDIAWSGTTTTFEKQKAEGADASTPSEAWKLTKPEAKDVDQTKMSDFLSNLSALRATSFTDKPLASGEEFDVTARYGDPASPNVEHVTILRSGDVVHAILPGEPGAMIVPNTDFDRALVGFKELSGIK